MSLTNRLWSELVQSIEAYQVSCAAGQPDMASLEQCKKLLDGISAVSQQGASTNWKRLVHVEQVPLRCCMACCKDSDTVAAMSRLLVAALFLFKQLASWDGALVLSDKPNALAISMGKQLQEGGLLQCLPTIATAAAADLAMLPEPSVVAVQLLEPGYDEPDVFDCRGTLLGSRSLQAMQWHGARLLLLLDSFEHLWSARQYASVVAPLRHAAAMEVATALICSISYCLEHLPPTLLAPPGLVRAMLEHACTAAWKAATDYKKHTEQLTRAERRSHQYALLLRSPHCLPCVAIGIMVTCCAMLLQDEQQAQRQLGDVQAQYAWQFASSNHDALPATHDVLLALLGCSSRAVLYAAALLDTSAAQRLRAAQQMFTLAEQSSEALFSSDHVQLLPTQQQEQQAQQILFLLPTVLLHWGAQYPSHRSSGVDVCDVASYIETLWLMLRVADDNKLQRKGARARALSDQTSHMPPPQQQQQGRHAAADAAAGQSVASSAAVAGAQQQVPGLGEPPFGLDQLLGSLDPLVVSEPLEFAAKLIKTISLHIEQQSSNNDTNTTAAASNYNGSGRGSTETQLLTLRFSFRRAVGCLQMAEEFVRIALAAQEAAGRSSAPLQQVSLSTWQQHAGELWSALESYVRWAARSGWAATAIPRVTGLLEPGKMWSLLSWAVEGAQSGSSSAQQLTSTSLLQLWSLLRSTKKAAGEQSSTAGTEDLCFETWHATVLQMVAMVLSEQDSTPAVLTTAPITCTSSSSSSGSQQLACGNDRGVDSSSTLDAAGSSAAPCSTAAAAAGSGATVEGMSPWLVLAGHSLAGWTDRLMTVMAVDEQILREVGRAPQSTLEVMAAGNAEQSKKHRAGMSNLSGQGSYERAAWEAVQAPGSAQESLCEAQTGNGNRARFADLVDVLLAYLHDNNSSSISSGAKLAAAGYPVVRAKAALQAVPDLCRILLWYPEFDVSLPNAGEEGWLHLLAALRARGPLARPVGHESELSLDQESRDYLWRLQRGLLVQSVLSAAIALWSCPFSWGCNNPDCTNLSGPSELLLVKGKARACSGCRTARYCSRECQTQHWPQHRPVCKALAAAAAGAKPPAGSGAAE